MFEASEMPELWEPALPAQNSTSTASTGTGSSGGGDERIAEVADLTSLLDTSKWPDGTRPGCAERTAASWSAAFAAAFRRVPLLGALD